MKADKRSMLIKKAIELARKIYQTPGGECGGPLHIVLDDGNLETENIQWCIDHIDDEWCKASEELKMLCLQCADVMLQLHERDRFKIYTKYDKEVPT